MPVWNIEITNEYYEWFQALDEATQDAVRTDIEVLEKLGPALGRPHVDSIKGSRHSNMKELRTIHARRHIRTFFAFDPAVAASCWSVATRLATRRFTSA